jgi:DNA (cytosine-5)-methyltransferase 1
LFEKGGAMQLSLFDGIQQFKIDKPIRLIELFAGIGSQAKALKNIGANFEHYRICEFDKYAVLSYNAVHGTNFETSDITKITADDLGIVDTDKFTYLLTYSFPCQDLSNAGKGLGMEKGSGTRSGLLWEVERLLDECKELPQVLLMENVPAVVGKKNKEVFYMWTDKLESLGYKNKWEILNAKDFGIPQNRERCFMVSILGDYFYEFPKTIPLTLRLKDMLETTVEEKYYLSKKGIEYFKKKINDFSDKRCEYISPYILSNNHGAFCGEIKDCTIHPTLTTDTAPSWKHLLLESLSKYELSEKMKRYINSYDDKYKVNDGNLVLNRDIAVAKTTREGSTRADASDYISLELSNNINIAKMDCTPYRIRKLTPKECWRLMGFEDTDIDRAILIGMSNAQLYKQAGNSIVVQVLEQIFKEML